MKRSIVTICLSVVIIAASLGAAHAYPVNAGIFFDGIDLDTSAPSGRLKSWWMTQKSAVKSGQWQRISEMPMYRGDATLRNSAALQATADNPAPTARLSPASLKKLSTTAGSLIRISDANGQIELPTEADARIPAGCVQIIAGHSETSALGSQGPVSLEAL